MFERFTERARQVVVLAQEEARSLKHNYIGTEHLLLGLLREEEGVAARVLESLDVSVEEVRAAVVRIVGSGEESPQGTIVDLLIGRLHTQIKASGVTIELTEAGRDLLVDKGYDPGLGARPLRRAIQRYIEDKLADAMLDRRFPEGTVVVVDGKDGDSVLTVNGEPVGGSVELPLVGVDEPVTVDVTATGGAPASVAAADDPSLDSAGSTS